MIEDIGYDTSQFDLHAENKIFIKKDKYEIIYASALK